MFFSKEFYGSYYKPLAKLKHPHISSLLQHVWNQKDDRRQLTMSALKATVEYQNCLSVINNSQLLEECAKGILMDIREFNKEPMHGQIAFVGKTGWTIGYKDGDQISENIEYGYKTLFACYAEGRVHASESSKREHFLVNCGVFSYAEIPKQYGVIMGVTGTLRTLAPAQKKLLLSEYKLNKQTFMPSVYSTSKCEFPKDSIKGVRFEANTESYNVAIVEEIKSRINKQSILVFFDSSDQLKAFRDSDQMKAEGYDHQAKLMYEETAASEKEGLVRQATAVHSLTLLTKEFGRGTDFVCYDEDLDSNGGIHVISTFLPEELSMEAQIKGRTARQGNKGSFGMVLRLQELDRFGIRAADADKMTSKNEIYDTLNSKRNTLFEAAYITSLEGASSIKEDDMKSNGFLQHLWNGDMAAANSFLLGINAKTLTSASTTSRTLVLMDATGSMSNLLGKAKNTVKQMFTRTYNCLKEKGDTTGVQMQFACYRNYNGGPEQLLEHSPWASEPDRLYTFMDSVGATGGSYIDGYEAVEIGLWHANEEADRLRASDDGEGDDGLTQVILIGDMPPNTVEDVERLRESHRRKGHSWATTKYKHPTHEAEQIERLKAQHTNDGTPIPVHAFYVDDDARSSFTRIAEATGGECQHLEVDTDRGAADLTRAVAKNILVGIGGETYGDFYDQKYPKGYTS